MGDDSEDADGSAGTRVSRRDVLGALSVVGTASVAGCGSLLSGGSTVEPSWEYDIEEAWAAGPPALVDGRVVVGAQDKALHAVDAGGGDRRLRVETGGWIHGRPAVPAGGGESTPIVHAHSADGDLYGVHLDDGAVWHVEGNHPDALTARAGGAVVHSPDGEEATSTDTVAYRASDGEELWRHGASAHGVKRGAGRAVIEVHDPTDVERHFHAALDTTDGTVAWQTDSDNPAVVGIDDDLTVLAGSGRLRGVDTGDGRQRWRGPLDSHLGFEMGYRFGPLFGAHVYLALEALDGDNDRERVAAFDRESGDRRWSESIDGSIRAMTADDHGVYVARYEPKGDGSVIRAIALDNDGDRRWATNIGQGAADRLLVAGRTVLVNLGHAVHAVDIESGDERWRYAPDTREVRIAADDDAVYASHTHEGRVLALAL
jgi:outer membrane protein assembly factor BamB